MDDDNIEPAEEAIILPSDEAGIKSADQSIIERAKEAIIEAAYQAIIERAEEAIIEPVEEAIIEPAGEVIIDPATEAVIEHGFGALNEAAPETDDARNCEERISITSISPYPKAIQGSERGATRKRKVQTACVVTSRPYKKQLIEGLKANEKCTIGRAKPRPKAVSSSKVGLENPRITLTSKCSRPRNKKY